MPSDSNKVMRGSKLLKKSDGVKGLPGDLLHVIFSKLGFRDKISAGMVCKEWEQQLHGGTAAARHWEVVYSLSEIARSTAQTPCGLRSPQEMIGAMTRWFAKRAPAIKSVCVHVDLFPLDYKQQLTTWMLVNAQLPTLAASLYIHAPTLEFEFIGGSPFQSPLLLSFSFMMLLCPMLKSLRLHQTVPLICPAQFAAICDLTRLERLEISESGTGSGGLQALTSDISKLVSLRVLTLDVWDADGYESKHISGLQRLEHLTLRQLSGPDVPTAYVPLTTPELLRLLVAKRDGVSIDPMPHDGLSTALSPQGLKSLSTVMLSGRCLALVPWELCSLSALTSLEVRNCIFVSVWLPSMLSRLTQLEELTINGCELDSLPAHISALANLRKLDVSRNVLTRLPHELSSLKNLREMQMVGNCFREVPVGVLSQLPALTIINVGYQDVTFKISSPLLPILHPGLLQLALEQFDPWDTISRCYIHQAVDEGAGMALFHHLCRL